MVKRLAGGNAVIEVKLTPSADARGVVLAADVQKIDADGSLGDLLRSGSLGTALREKIARSVQSAIQKGMNFQSSLPPAIAGAITVNGARFAAGGDARLWLNLDGDVRLSADQFQSLAGAMKPH
jgi:hypothetical protein